MPNFIDERLMRGWLDASAACEGRVVFLTSANNPFDSSRLLEKVVLEA